VDCREEIESDYPNVWDVTVAMAAIGRLGGDGNIIPPQDNRVRASAPVYLKCWCGKPMSNESGKRGRKKKFCNKRCYDRSLAAAKRKAA
jgi:hypothetical protein